MDKLEKIAWLVRLREPKPLGMDEQTDLADSLNFLWFRKGCGRGAKSEYSARWVAFLNDWANAHRDNLVFEAEKIKQDNERPRGGLRTTAKHALAERYGISVRTLDNWMKRLPMPRRKTT